MKKMILLVTLSLALAPQAFASKVCTGNLIVDNVGLISTVPATLELVTDTEAIYTGPHASIDLVSPITLQFKSTSQGWFFSNLSGSGHGAETNRFWKKHQADNKVHFVYEGTYGYRAEGVLTCQ